MLKSCLFPFSLCCEKGTKSGAKETPGSPLPIGVARGSPRARTRVCFRERLRQWLERERVANYLELPNNSTKNLQGNSSFPAALRARSCMDVVGTYI